MALADAIAMQVKKPGTKCQVGVAVVAMTADDVATLNSHLASKTPSAAIWRALLAEGHDSVGKGAVERHRAGECACGSR